MAGSYHIEALTDRIEKDAYELIQEIENMGGALAALKTGFQQRRIHESAWKQTTDVENLHRKVVGVNHAQMDNEPEIEGQMINP